MALGGSEGGGCFLMGEVPLQPQERERDRRRRGALQLCPALRSLRGAGGLGCRMWGLRLRM